MYAQVIAQLAQSLSNIEVWLDKAESFYAAKGRDKNGLLTARLAPDMKPFVYQIQSASDYVKAGAAHLSGHRLPSFADTERSITEVRSRISRTVEFVEGISIFDFHGAADRQVQWAGKTLRAEDYLLQILIPNSYFHIAMAYAIMRNQGVEVGKMDFLGYIEFLPG